MIGEIVPRRTVRSQPGQVSGVLVPRPGVALPKGGFQHHIAVAGQSWVAELPAPDLNGTRRPHARGELKPQPPGSPLGIPQEEQLSIRGEGQELVRVRAISAIEHPLHHEQPAEEISALPDGAIVNGSVWLVDFWLGSDAADT